MMEINASVEDLVKEFGSTVLTSTSAVPLLRGSVAMTVDVTDRDVVVSSERSFATFNWKTDDWGSGSTKRLAIVGARRHTLNGDIEEDVFKIVSAHGDDSPYSRAEILADDLREDEALDLLRGRFKKTARHV